MEVTKAICAITAEVGALGKNKKNEQQGYSFRGVDDLMNALHPKRLHLYANFVNH